MYSTWHDWDSTLVTNRVMDSGIHRISLIYTVPTKETISTMMGFEVEQLGTNFLSKPPRNFVSAAVDRYSMALFGVVPDCLTLAPRDRCMTRGPAWIMNQFNGKRIFGSGAEVGNTEMNPGGGDWTDYGSVGSSENVGVGKIEGGQVLSMELNMDVGTLKFWVDGHLHGPGFTGIRPGDFGGRLRWATCVTKVGMSVRIVPTPTLEGV